MLRTKIRDINITTASKQTDKYCIRDWVFFPRKTDRIKSEFDTLIQYFNIRPPEMKHDIGARKVCQPKNQMHEFPL